MSRNLNSKRFFPAIRQRYSIFYVAKWAVFILAYARQIPGDYRPTTQTSRSLRYDWCCWISKNLYNILSFFDMLCLTNKMSWTDITQIKLLMKIQANHC